MRKNHDNVADVFPEKTLEQHMVILGKTGSGKTTTAKGVVEKILDEGGRVCVIDPTGAWWGMKSSATGKSAAYPFVIFGGRHADLPLESAHGEAIAEVVGTSNTPAIIDTKLMTVGDRTRFFTAFAEALMRKNQGPLHLVIDEAHVFMPQGKVQSPQAGMMLSAGNELVSGGRSAGLRVMLISQRPAKLHKDSLTQVETMVAMKLIAPQDRHAIQDWIEDNADMVKGKEIISSLAELNTGEGWIWAPGSKVLERVKFPHIKTFDSSKAPDGSSLDGKQVLAAIDRDSIAMKLKDVGADALANDPKALKAELNKVRRLLDIEQRALSAELERNAGALSGATQDAESLGYEQGWNDCWSQIAGLVDGVEKPKKTRAVGLVHPPGKQSPVSKVTVFKTDWGASAPNLTKVIYGHDIKHYPEVNVDRASGLTGPEQRVVNAIGWLEGIGVKDPQKTAVAFLADYTYGSGGFNNPCGSLNRKGLIEYLPNDRIRLTEAGKREAVPSPAPLTNEELHRHVLGRLPGPEQRVLKPLLEAYPDALSHADLAAASNYKLGSGGFNNPRGRLKSLGLIDYPLGGSRAADCLFPEGV